MSVTLSARLSDMGESTFYPVSKLDVFTVVLRIQQGIEHPCLEMDITGGLYRKKGHFRVPFFCSRASHLA